MIKYTSKTMDMMNLVLMITVNYTKIQFKTVQTSFFLSKYENIILILISRQNTSQ